MEFVRLGPPYSGTYDKAELIEGYSSLVWTERQQEFSDFELKSPLVRKFQDLLPEDTLVSHLETRVVMRVQTQSIDWVGEGVDAYPEITIKGRCASDILAHRFVDSTYGKERRMRQSYSATAAALVLISNAIDNTSGYDITRGDKTASTPDVDSYIWNTLDALPNVMVTENVANEGSARWWMLKQGMLWPQLQEILKSQELGVRVLRPVLPNSGTVITVDTALASRGTIRRLPYSDSLALEFQVYSGVDRSSSVTFSLLQGHVDKPQYLVSKANYKSVVQVMTGVGLAAGAVYRPGESSLTGWKRHAAEFDAGTAEQPKKPNRPKKPKSSASRATKDAYNKAYDKYVDDYQLWLNKRYSWDDDFKAESVLKAKDLLAQSQRVDMFAGDDSGLSPWKYGTHYNLGDRVTVVGEYGKNSQMIVREHVRTENAEGDRGFPGLVAPIEDTE